MSLRLAAFALALAAACAAGWAANGWRLNAKHTEQDLARTKEALRLIEQRDALGERLAAQNDKHLEELGKAQYETNRLRTCLADGTCGLRIVEGACPAMPGPSASSGVDSGTGAGPSTVAGQAYIALREGIDLTEAKLNACQVELRARSVR
jgi:prophage endopeptidase